MNLANSVAFMDRIHRLKVPVPFPLRWINSYIIRGQEGYTVIDPGLNTEAARDVWLSWLREHRISMRDIQHIVLTHHHPDHYGLSGWMQEASGAPVSLSARALEQVRLLWQEPFEMNARLLACYREYGMPPDVLDQVERNMRSFVAQVSPQPEQLHVLKPGESLLLGDQAWQMIESHGHAFGHLSFYHAEQQVLFCGDHVLPVITPNVSYMPGLDENPLASFLDSLEQLAQLPVRHALPGHRDPFSHFRERSLELIRHHEERLDQIQALGKQRMTAYELCQALFGTRLTIHQLRFAMGETIAHWIYLEKSSQSPSPADTPLL